MGTASDLYLFYCLESHGVITQGTWAFYNTRNVARISESQKMCDSLRCRQHFQFIHWKFQVQILAQIPVFLAKFFVAFSNPSTIGLCSSKQATIASINIYSNLSIKNYPAYHSHITLSIIHKLPQQSFTHYPTYYAQITPHIIHKFFYQPYTNYPTSHQRFTRPIHNITLPVIHRLPYYIFLTNYPTCYSQITLPTIFKLNYPSNHSQHIKLAHKLHSLSTNYRSNHLQWNHDDFQGLRKGAQATTYLYVSWPVAYCPHPRR